MLTGSHRLGSRRLSFTTDHFVISPSCLHFPSSPSSPFHLRYATLMFRDYHYFALSMGRILLMMSDGRITYHHAAHHFHATRHAPALHYAFAIHYHHSLDIVIRHFHFRLEMPTPTPAVLAAYAHRSFILVLLNTLPPGHHAEFIHLVEHYADIALKNIITLFSA